MKNLKAKTQKGFSLVELMVVVAIIAILAAVAIPMYSNYTTRAKVSSEISKLGGIKAQAAEALTQTDGSTQKNNLIAAANTDANTLSSGSTVAVSGSTAVVIDYVMDTAQVPAGDIRLTGTASNGAVTWACAIEGNGNYTSSTVPADCTIAN
ncbi:pilin [Francisella sp. LA112445]|uniref:pilin n=1 Tax=Francisella sp. LA112445 TaxID=1395624 RepID=UPI001788D061|nr:pilin [Francisella sp. LA112445]QIW09530.1 prepilin-type N-terminal cleavage/methylation domain-containing protein [Francisella sp. LA112445]